MGPSCIGLHWNVTADAWHVLGALTPTPRTREPSEPTHMGRWAHIMSAQEISLDYLVMELRNWA